LSLDDDISNSGVTALDVILTGSMVTNGVTLVNPTPAPLGDIAQSSSWLGQLKYNVPLHVNSFRVVTSATARDLCGDSFSYPGPYPGA